MCRFAPPVEDKHQKRLNVKRVAFAVSSAFIGSLFCVSNLAFAEALNLIDTDGDWRQGTEGSDQTHGKDRVLFSLKDNKTASYSSLHIDHYAPITNSQFTLDVENGATLNINGDTVGRSYADDNSYIKASWGHGTYLIYAIGNSRNKETKSTINLNGNVDLTVTHSLEEHLTSIGANLLYARYNSTINVGTEDSFSRLWVLAGQPDLISAKNGGKVIVKSTNNQWVGSIDTMDSVDDSWSPSEIKVTFSGPNSYWVGDERSWQNSDYRYEYEKVQDQDVIDLTFENGAQWIYLGLHGNRDEKYWTVPKRISSITLNQGIINLYDVDVRGFLTEIGLLERLQNEQYGLPANTKYDYVRIGNLKGSGGIFRMDLDGTDKNQSDMLYIESGEGTHYFEPYNLILLEPITPENTLTFALVGQNGKDLKFQDKQNLLGETLFDYELEIASKPITAEDLADEKNSYWDKTADVVVEGEHQAELAAEKIDMSEFVDGTNWFIRRVTLQESAAAVGMTGAGYASYDAAIEMDRRDRRLTEQVRDLENADNGMWVRVHHGRSGAESQYRWDRTGVTVGYDRQITDSNRLGAYFTYTEGETEFLDVRGDGDMKRYELALYDTLEMGQHYLDFVGRIGRVCSDYSVGNQSYSTSGDFDQDYAALSAEYGYQLLDANGVFVEPQLQVQVAYVDGYDYDSERGMRVEADSETSVIGRVGLRAGREFKGSTSQGSLYARTDVYHQFTEGQDAVFSDRDGHALKVNWGDTDTWVSLGLGTSWVWKNRLGLQVDVEKITGGKTADTWLMSGRFSYLF